MSRLDSIEQTERMNVLMDYYGELLTERQRHFMRVYYDENHSLAEIAEQENITRQAVRDILVRSCALLERYEDKVRFLEYMTSQRDSLDLVERCLFAMNDLNQKEFRSKKLLDICNRMYESLMKAKGEDHD